MDYAFLVGNSTTFSPRCKVTQTTMFDLPHVFVICQYYIKTAYTSCWFLEYMFHSTSCTV